MSVKTLAAKEQGHGQVLRPDENPFSTNKVTGHSLNFPIIATCTPTTVCAETCYFACGPATWSASLAKQYRLLNSLRADPPLLADTIAVWASKLRLTFIRWCGGGDLVAETPPCIDAVAAALPAVPQWVVTRKPQFASLITPAENVFVHFSVDRSSWRRLEEMRQLAPAGLKWFWSYQCDDGELPPEDIASVVFRDGYDLAGDRPTADDCPLNLSESIAGVCEGCRRCFDGRAVARAAALDAKLSGKTMVR